LAKKKLNPGGKKTLMIKIKKNLRGYKYIWPQYLYHTKIFSVFYNISAHFLSLYSTLFQVFMTSTKDDDNNNNSNNNKSTLDTKNITFDTKQDRWD
jgi:hypothetical protein